MFSSFLLDSSYFSLDDPGNTEKCFNQILIGGTIEVALESDEISQVSLLSYHLPISCSASTSVELLNLVWLIGVLLGLIGSTVNEFLLFLIKLFHASVPF